LIGYDESQVVAFEQDVVAAYKAAGRTPDLENVVWATRMVYDATAGNLGYAASRQKHLAELEAALNPGPVGPFKPAPRFWSGQMCGLHIAGLPLVQGGAPDPSLFLSWFYDRYDTDTRTKIRSAMKAKGYTHFLLSWPDSSAFGTGINKFKELCQGLIADGFYPCVMLASKDFDPADVRAIAASAGPVIDALVGIVPMFCVGWELSLWLSPTQVQELIDTLSPRWLKQPGTLGYVHFGERVFSWQQNGQNTAAFWAANVGKLTGILAQKELAADDATFLDWIHDCLVRCAGQFFMPTDSGFGHPFDFVMLEISAALQFNGTCSEAEGNRLGQLAITAPSESGPAGTVKVMGSGNGA
jgi:hypothetical protein